MAGMTSSYARPAAARPGGVVAPYQGPTDPHTGLPVVKLTQAAHDAKMAQDARDAALIRGRTDFYQAANRNANYSAQYTDPRTGLSLQYGPGGGASGSGSGAKDYGVEDFDFNGALAQVQGALPRFVPRDPLPGRVVASTPADAAAAEASEFGRAKDRIGRLGRGSLSSMQDEFSARGMGGSGMEAGATSALLADLQGQQGEVIRDQNIQGLQRKRQVEDRNYAGDLNQRGQDIGFTTTTRGQDIDQERNRSQMQVPLMQLIAANRKRRTTPLY